MKPWKSYTTVDTMQKQNMNWFATVLRVVICFIILTDLTELSVEFCVDEVFEDRGCLDVRRRMRGRAQSWGCPARHPIFLQQVSVCFRFRFVRVTCANLGASFAFSFHFLLCTMLVWDSPWLIYRMLIALHLYLLSVAL